MFADQQSCDQKTRHHKENIDSDKSASEPKKFGVKENYEADSKCPKTFDIASKHVVVETGVDPVTFRFSGGRSAD